MDHSSIFARLMKVSYDAYNNINGYVWQDIGNNTICLAFSGSLDSSAFRETDTKFDVCKINEGNNYFPSMVDGTTRKDPREPARVYREALRKFVRTWDGNLKQQVAKALGTGKSVLFTGHSIGGAIAILATLSSLEDWGKDAPVFGTTFGFPLIGDEVLARAVRRQGWANHFFNIISMGDVFARTLLAPCESVSSPLEALLPYWQNSVKQMNDEDSDIPMGPADLFPKYLSTVVAHAGAVVALITFTNTDPTNTLIASSPRLNPYRPFGYYLFCSDKGALCVENYEAVLPILFYSLASYHDQASISDHIEYDKVFHANTNIANLAGLPNLPLSQDAPSSAMEIQLEALGLGIQMMATGVTIDRINFSSTPVHLGHPFGGSSTLNPPSQGVSSAPPSLGISHDTLTVDTTMRMGIVAHLDNPSLYQESTAFQELVSDTFHEQHTAHVEQEDRGDGQPDTIDSEHGDTGPSAPEHTSQPHTSDSGHLSSSHGVKRTLDDRDSI